MSCGLPLARLRRAAGLRPRPLPRLAEREVRLEPPASRQSSGQRSPEPLHLSGLPQRALGTYISRKHDREPNRSTKSPTFWEQARLVSQRLGSGTAFFLLFARTVRVVFSNDVHAAGGCSAARCSRL